MFYAGMAADARTRLALAKLPMTPRSVVVVSRPGGAAAFKARFSTCLAPAAIGSVIPIAGPRGPRLLSMADGPSALVAIANCDGIFFESLPTRPFDAVKTLDIAVALARLSLDKTAMISAGVFAANDTEALVLERTLVDFGVPPEQVVAGWLNGVGNCSFRYVRVPARSLVTPGSTRPASMDDDARCVVDFWRYSSTRRSRR